MSTSVSAVTNHFPSAENGFATTTATITASGATTVELNSLAGYENGEVVVFVIEPTSATAKQTFTGVVDTAGVQITDVVWTAGTNQEHGAGVTVVDYATATHISMISKGLSVEHNQDGTHKATVLPPVGIISPYAGTSAPTGWLLCDGSAVSRSTYSSLYALIGTTYGTGDGSTTFNLPDISGRVPVGKDSATFSDLGDSGGEEGHVLTTDEMPAHTHTGSTSSGGSHTHGYTAPTSPITVKAINTADTALGHVPGRSSTSTGSAGTHSHTFTTASRGGGGAHNNLQPYIVLNYIIKV